MDTYIVVLIVMGLAFLSAAWVPHLVYNRPLSFPFLYVALGFVLFKLPLGIYLPNPLESSFFTQHVTEILVIISLTGAGLKLARPVGLRSWAATWRLLLIAMPLCIGLAALLGWWVLGLTPAAAVLLGAVLAPTDPVLASDVQVGPPGDAKEGEVRFALTSEAGLNDGLAFPFTYLAIALAAAGEGGQAQLGEWAITDGLYRVVVGGLAGLLIGAALTRLIFRLPGGAKIAGSRDGFVVIGITLLAYGVTELLHGYGFLAVFIAALTIRQSEREHSYHEELHSFAEGFERLLMTLVLILFGGLLAEGLLANLNWRIAVVGLAILLLVRPVTALVSLSRLRLSREERLAISFFGIRGVGSLYYLAFALNRQFFDGSSVLWPTVSFVILMSILLHGGSASYVMRRLDRRGAQASGHDEEHALTETGR